MVLYAGVDTLKAVTAADGIESVLKNIADRIEADFQRWDAFEKQPRIASHTPEGVIELMPAADNRRYAFKYVNGHPVNADKGLLTVTAFGVLADRDTGYPLLLSEMTLLTAMRTAAMSALAARYLAPAGAEVMAMIGTGAQAEFQAYAFGAVTGVKTVRIFDKNPAAMDKFERNMAASGLRIERCGDAEEAVRGAAIVTTCTAAKRKAAILTDSMIGAGVHINAVGGDCPGKTEIDPALLRRAAIFVELPEQTRIEGEIQQLAPDHPVTELHAVFTGAAPGRADAAQVTVFDSVGFAIEDFSALSWLYDRLAGGNGEAAGARAIDLIPALDDPRDLYGVLNGLRG